MVDREVVVTGIGIVSPLGIGVEPFWESLRAGRSGIATIPELAATPFPVTFGGAVPDFDPKQYITPRKSLKVMCRELQLAFAATRLAAESAGYEGALARLDRDRVGVVFGCDMLYSELPEIEPLLRSCLVEGRFHFPLFGRHCTQQLFPLWILKYLPNMAACHVSISQDARGPCNTIVHGDISSTLALIEAMHLIERGAADLVFSGGAGSRLDWTPRVYRTHTNLSKGSTDPAAACRPFDRRRDGMVLGEGAAVWVLESRAHAEARGAPIWARLVSGQVQFDAPRQGIESRIDAYRRVLHRGLQAAALDVRQLDHLNAHGRSTREEDAAEAQAIRAVLGDLPVLAPKSYFGNIGAASGALELAVSLLACQHGWVPATLNYDDPDPDCPVNVIAGSGKRLERSAIIKLDASISGQVAALVLQATDQP